jgi:polyisoprenoid-binding protein YceI
MRHRCAVIALSWFILGPGLLAGQVASREKAANQPAPVLYELAPAGNEVRFIVREQLVGAELPNEAIGKTTAITGAVGFDAKGVLDPKASRFTVDLRTLTSDKDRRDRFIKRNTLVTDSFPNAELVVKELRGFPAKLPASGSFSFVLLGDLTVHGVTRPSSWEVTASVNGESLSGRATTHLRFGDFAMERPRVMVVLSVVDDIKLEFDFHFVKAGNP